MGKGPLKLPSVLKQQLGVADHGTNSKGKGKAKHGGGATLSRKEVSGFSGRSKNKSKCKVKDGYIHYWRLQKRKQERMEKKQRKAVGGGSKRPRDDEQVI